VPTPTPPGGGLVFEETWEDGEPWASGLKPSAEWGSNDPGPYASHKVNTDITYEGSHSGWLYANAHTNASIPQRYVWARRRVTGFVPGMGYRFSFRVATKAHDWPNGYARFGYNWALTETCTESGDPPGLVSPGDPSSGWVPNDDIDARCAAAGYGTFVEYTTAFTAVAASLDLWAVCRRTAPASATEWTEIFLDNIRIEPTQQPPAGIERGLWWFY
jgi:hypothetical protein